MYLKHHLLSDADVELFRRTLAPLASDAFLRAPDSERLSRLAAAIAGLGIDAAKWKDLHDALALRGDALVRRVQYAMYFFPSSFVHLRSRGEHSQTNGTFTLHAWLLHTATGRPELAPLSGAARSVEFSSSHFRRFAWLSASEAQSVRLQRPFSELREAARGRGDAPAWPKARVDEHVENCIRQCEAVLRFVESARRQGLAVLSEVNNTDWDYD
ncbi:MAG: hypothetical protein IT377_04185 [Polyangiaceae bacterium]|nr:hypothetical protein [Polyangiaceae bacterium]